MQVQYPDGHLEGMTRDEFVAYTEKVFRDHNKVVNDLILTVSLLGDDVTNNASLVRAEAAMALACHPLNDAVAATIEGRELGFFHKLQMPRAVPACELASKAMQELLDKRPY